MRLLIGMGAILAVCTPLKADDSLPAEILARIKGATVFIKVKLGSVERTGSGFFFKNTNDYALIATSRHVVFGADNTDTARPKIQVIVHSGQKKENSLSAELVASDKDRDLAILRVEASKALPQSLDVSEQPELMETLTVFAIGFPFGEELSSTKGNPSPTISKGTISSLRNNDRGEMAKIQIDGSIHPGNSGGPVVDRKGRVLGIAVAKVRGTNIGIAIPARELRELLKGRLSNLGLRVGRVKDGLAKVDVTLDLIDPLNEIEKASVRYIRNDTFEEFKADKNGKWSPLPGGENVELKIADGTAQGQVALKSKEKIPVYYNFQSVVVRRDGAIVHGEPTNPVRVRFGPNLEANTPTMPFRSKVIEVTPNASADWLFKEAKNGVRVFTDQDFVFTSLPDEIVGGTMMLRSGKESRNWLEPQTLSALKDGTVIAIFRWKHLRKVSINEATFAKFDKEGWEEVEGMVESTFPNGEDWRWKARRKSVKSGEIVLQLKKVEWKDETPVIFVFK